MSMQEKINKFNEDSHIERGASQMTLGRLIFKLANLPGNQKIEFLREPHSYRGYYTDLAFQIGEISSVKELLEQLKDCIDETFKGYKGGDFTMKNDTPIWIAEYGCAGLKIIDIDETTEILTFVTKENN